MTIHKEGYTSIALCILFIFVSNALIQFYMPQATTFKWIVYILSFLLFVAVVYFFRSPSVDVISDEKAVLSPADGKVVSIEEVNEPEFLKGRSTKISIAISPLNTHTNRNPVKGTVKYVNTDGHTTIAVENAAGTPIVYRQIPGFSKRIITYVKQGDAVEQGQKFGFSMLGSKLEVFLPIGTNVDVDVDDAVKGGHTILARLKS
ncbi:MAG: phosphatidylserine decarboxylase [Mucilaginibacter sp.]|uniref:phosphatidylserine decarboxylase n=1 Tax=Mucilaginibacter sp. TaxID=1882438 RepID=UPI003264EC73